MVAPGWQAMLFRILSAAITPSKKEVAAHNGRLGPPICGESYLKTLRHPTELSRNGGGMPAQSGRVPISRQDLVAAAGCRAPQANARQDVLSRPRRHGPDENSGVRQYGPRTRPERPPSDLASRQGLPD